METTILNKINNTLNFLTVISGCIVVLLVIIIFKIPNNTIIDEVTVSQVDTVYVKNTVISVQHPDYPTNVNITGINGYRPACYWANDEKEVVTLGVR